MSKKMKKLKAETKAHAFIKKYFMIIVVFAIMLIPSIYTVLFLGSMWDPYGNTGNLPVAIVNEDKPIVYDGRVVNIGEQLCDKLKDNKSLKFNFVNEQTALDGLENATYYMVMVIPSDFSANSVTLTSDNPQKMQLEYYVNPGTNYIASKFGESAVKTIKEQINKTVINTYATTVYGKLGTIHDGFLAAADGSGQIGDGVSKLKGGNLQITNGLDTLSNGCLVLKEGTGTLQDGLKQYTDGVNQVDAGVSQIQGGTKQLVANNQKLNDGAEQLLGGLNLMSDQIGESLTEENLKDLQTLEDGLLELNDGIQTLQKAINEDYRISDDTIKKAQDTLKTADEFVKSDTFKNISQIISHSDIDYDSLIQRIDLLEMLLPNEKENLESLKKTLITLQEIQKFGEKVTPENAQKLITTANGVVNAYGTLTDGVQRLSDGGNLALPAASDTLKKMTGGLQSVKNGLDRTVEKDGETGLIEGMTTLKEGISTYTGGVSQVDDGVGQVADGLDKLTANNGKLNSGASKLNGGAGQLYDGSVKLLDGSEQIGDGCNKLLAGANTLETSLLDGAKQIEDTNTGEDSADMFSQPVDAKETFQRNINSNGEAMSAYMMCAGLWVACLAFCLMFSPFNTSLKSRKTFFRHAAIAGFVAVLAPIIMVTLLSAINGLRPAHPIETYMMAILTSMAFMTVVYMLNTMFDSIGSFALLVLLCLQLSGAAGTYPIELSPKFYQIIHPFMPFTYGVDAFRSTLSTGNSLVTDVMVFAGIIVVCGVLTLLTYDLRQIKLRRKARLEQQADLAEAEE
ncbi:MAG: YhgE/Pip domain-containing protein [Ruminococcaceae bacterium]|nr:YhgE/Pip domain-containing protein [Oscillospiraceae bacterium]